MRQTHVITFFKMENLFEVSGEQSPQQSLETLLDIFFQMHSLWRQKFERQTKVNDTLTFYKSTYCQKKNVEGNSSYFSSCILLKNIIVF